MEHSQIQSDHIKKTHQSKNQNPEKNGSFKNGYINCRNKTQLTAMEILKQLKANLGKSYRTRSPNSIIQH